MTGRAGGLTRRTSVYSATNIIIIIVEKSLPPYAYCLAGTGVFLAAGPESGLLEDPRGAYRDRFLMNKHGAVEIGALPWGFTGFLDHMHTFDCLLLV